MCSKEATLDERIHQKGNAVDMVAFPAVGLASGGLVDEAAADPSDALVLPQWY